MKKLSVRRETREIFLENIGSENIRKVKALNKKDNKKDYNKKEIIIEEINDIPTENSEKLFEIDNNKKLITKMKD